MKHISLERLWSEGRKAGIILLVCVMPISITACGQTDVVEETPITSQETEKMVLTINGEMVSVKWEDNESVEALMEFVSTEPLSIQMSMYGGFEQVGSMGTTLPREDKQITTEAGDIVLYSGNQIVIFYGSNSWAYTRLGKVTDKSKTEMTELLGNGDVTIIISEE